MYVNGAGLILSVLYGLTLIVLATTDQIVSIRPSVSTLIVPKNSRLVLDCPVTSEAILTYSWTKNGVELSSQKRVYIASNGSLIIENIINKRWKGRNDTGVYECYVSNKYGTFIGRQVEIIISKQSFSIEPVQVEPVLGGVARFQCKVNATSQKSPFYVWEHLGGGHLDNSRVSSNNGILQIHDVSTIDEGLYTCKVFATLDDNIDILEKSAFLKIKSGPLPKEPQLLNTPQNINVIVGEPVLMECLVEGGEDVSITWQYPDGRLILPIDSGRLNLSGTSNIKISFTISKDSGSYICVVKHSGGPDIRRVYTLNIQVAPKIVMAPFLKYENPLVKRERLPCNATGNPYPIYEWYKDGLKIYPAPSLQIKHELVLHGRFEDSGYYQCIAKNSIGYAVATTWVSFKRTSNTPEKVENVIAMALSSTEVNVTWSPARTPEDVMAYSIDFYPVDTFQCPGKCLYVFERQREVSRDNFKVMKDLKPFTEYSFAIQAFSIMGAGILSKAATVRTKEAVPTSVPNVQIIPDSITSFRVNWTELPVSERHGIINRYELKYGTKLKMTVIELTGDITDYLVTGLEPDTSYEVRVIAGNSAGYPNISNNWVTCKTPKGDKSIVVSPTLTLDSINSSAVLIGWNGGNFDSVRSYRVIIQKLLKSGPVREYNLSADKHQLLIGGLENRTFYEIYFMVKNNNNDAIGSVTELYQSLEPDIEREPPPPKIQDPVQLTSSLISLSWERPKTSVTITKYTVRYKQRDGDVAKYIESNQLKATLEGLLPFTWYAIEVRSHTETRAGPFSKPVMVQTKEGIPSPPEILVAEVISPGTVKLEWEPPSQQNGIITYYIIYYNPDKDEPDKVWSSILQNASATSVLVEDLKSKVYYFKLRACTNAGEGLPSHIIMIDTLICNQKGCPACLPSQLCVKESTPKVSNVLEQRLGIIIGCAVGLVCIVFCVIFLVIRHRQLSARYQSRTETRIIHTSRNDQHVGRYLSQQLQGQTVCNTRYSPILGQLPENENSDSKGGHCVPDNDSKVLVNGGLVNYYTGHRVVAEQRALLSPSTSSSQGNDTSGNPTPETGTLDSSFTTPDSLEYEVSYNRIRHNDSLDIEGEYNDSCVSNTAESCSASRHSVDDFVKVNGEYENIEAGQI